MKRFNVIFRGEVLAENLSYEDAADTLHELALKYFESYDDFNPEDITIEELE